MDDWQLVFYSRSQRRCMLGDLKCTPVPWLNFGHQSSSTEVCRFCCPCGCAEAWCQWLCAAPPLRTQRSKISAFDKALFESKALGQAGPECCSQKTWYFLFWLNVLGTLAGVQMRIHPSDTPECLCRRWHHVRLGPEDARDWARQVAMPITPQTMLAFYMRSWRSVLSCITIPIQPSVFRYPLPQNTLCVVSSGRKSPCLPIILDARVARLLAGKAVGVCFGGGGARGNVHFGVIQAMQELGIPIDVVSGTSFGALAAAMPLALQGE